MRFEADDAGRVVSRAMHSHEQLTIRSAQIMSANQSSLINLN